MADKNISDPNHQGVNMNMHDHSGLKLILAIVALLAIGWGVLVPTGSISAKAGKLEAPSGQ